MCEQCSAEVDEYGHPLPGWMLCQATEKGSFMKKGDWGLVECNDPTFVWTDTPLIDPEVGLTDAEINAMPNYWEVTSKFSDPAGRFDEALLCSPDEGWKLYESCVKVGYDRAKHGRLAPWLFDFLARWLKANPIPTRRSKDDQDVGDVI